MSSSQHDNAVNNTGMCAPPVISPETITKLTLVGLIPVILLFLWMFNETSTHINKNTVRWSIIPYFFISGMAFVMLLFMAFINYYDFSNVSSIPWYLLVSPLLIMLGVFLGGGYCIGPFVKKCS